MSTCKISVVMSTYNESIPVLKEAIDSILSQTYRDFEFIIVLDNPGNIDIKNTVEAYSGQDDRIRVIYHSENRGLVQSLNDGIKVANGELIARMDADDIANPRMLEEELFRLSKCDADMVSASKYNINEKDEISGTYLDDFDTKKINRLIRYGNPINHPSAMFKKGIVASVDGYRNIDSCEDYDLWVRLVLMRYRIVVIPELLLKYRVRENSISRTDYYRQFVSRRFIKKEIEVYKREQRILSEQEYNSYKAKYESSNCHVGKYNKAYKLFYEGLEAFQEKKAAKAIKCFIKSVLSDKRVFYDLKDKVVYGLIKRYG